MEKALNSLPRHVGLIPDGNRRWAKSHNLPLVEGHRRGYEAIKKIIEAAEKKGIEIFTFWSFSTENWDRPKEEVNYLMDLIEQSLDEFEKISGTRMRFRVIGQKERFRPSIREKIDRVEKATKDNKGMAVNMGLSYGGRDEIIQGIKKAAQLGIKPQDITEKNISDNLWLPDIDMIIRTSGEHRLSGFLAWQSAYAELFFPEKFLPDFGPKDFDKLLSEYANRERRFGK